MKGKIILLSYAASVMKMLMKKTCLYAVISVINGIISNVISQKLR
jgi:hypothetical protein